MVQVVEFPSQLILGLVINKKYAREVSELIEVADWATVIMRWFLSSLKQDGMQKRARSMRKTDWEELRQEIKTAIWNKELAGRTVGDMRAAFKEKIQVVTDKYLLWWEAVQRETSVDEPEIMCAVGEKKKQLWKKVKAKTVTEE